MPTRADLDRFYRRYRDPRATDAVVEKNARRNLRRLIRHGLTRRSRLLDHGAGRGAFSRLGGVSWKSYDPYTLPGTSLPAGTGVLDWVTLWGVLEHLTDPCRVVGRLAAKLAPGGHMALTTVTIESSIPYRHKPPEHVTYWTRPAAEVLLARSSLSLVDYRPYTMVQRAEVYLGAVLRTVPERLRGKIRHRLPEFVVVPTNEIWLVARKR